MSPRTILWLGAVVHLASWPMPVLRISSRSSDQFMGWDAFRAAIWPFESGGDPWYQALHYVASALSNLPLVGALALVLIARRPPPRWLVGLVAASAVLNTHWVLFTFSGDRGDLRVGYYAWLLSFFVVAAGLFLEAKRTAPGPAA